jgi:hypothetical protein
MKPPPPSFCTFSSNPTDDVSASAAVVDLFLQGIDGANDAAVLGWFHFVSVSINGANDAVGVIVMEEELSIRVTASCIFLLHQHTLGASMVPKMQRDDTSVFLLSTLPTMQTMQRDGSVFWMSVVQTMHWGCGSFFCFYFFPFLLHDDAKFFSPQWSGAIKIDG